MVDPNGNFPFFILTILIGACSDVGIGYVVRATDIIGLGYGKAITIFIKGIIGFILI